MVDRHCIEDIEQHLTNGTATILLHMWKSPRSIVIRIEALALLAIVLSFLLAIFGSCRRWSNHWIVQKGILAANVLSLSLGTYSIGLMQSSSVKSEMYPIWAVSMLTLLGCTDSFAVYGLDYKNQLWKMLSQLCLYCGYVFLISISTISSNVGYIAIGVLSAITFIKGFHRSLALVLPSRMRDMIRMIAHHMEEETLRMSRGRRERMNNRTEKKSTFFYDNLYYNPTDIVGYHYVVHWFRVRRTGSSDPWVSSSKKAWENYEILTMDEVSRCRKGKLDVESWIDVCLSLSLSHMLQRRFFGLNCAESEQMMTHELVFEGLLLKHHEVLDYHERDYERAFKVVEVELAFLYDIFFSSESFLYHYESKTATFFAIASVIGISFVGVAAAIPGARTTRPSGVTVVVDTTTADLVVTLVILVSLALLQVLQLLRCWTSNWARVALVCDYIRNDQEASCWMTLRHWILRRINWFDSYLWHNKLGQYSLVESVASNRCKLLRALGGRLYQIYSPLSTMLGLQYIEQVLQELLGNQTGDDVVLQPEVKAAIVDFLTRHKGEIGSFTFHTIERSEYYSYYEDDIIKLILKWHIATCYSELEQKSRQDIPARDENFSIRNKGVATTLSKYCAYLLVSMPQLLPGQQVYTETIHLEVVSVARLILQGDSDKLEAMKGISFPLQQTVESNDGREAMKKFLRGLGHAVESAKDRQAMAWIQLLYDEWCHSQEELDIIRISQLWEKAEEKLVEYIHSHDGYRIVWQGLELGRRLSSITDFWKVQADFWVEALLCIAISDKAEEHIRQLSQGGEFITHLWALLSHAGILKRRDPSNSSV